MAHKGQKSSSDSLRPADITDRDAFTDSGDMKLQQLLVFVLSFTMYEASGNHSCFTEQDLEHQVRHKLYNHHYQAAVPTQASTVPLRCNPELYTRDQTMDQDRSISPWTYVDRHLPEHFPSKYTEAQCLCKGCIVFNEDWEPKENHNYNSKPVTQSRMFLKRVLCENTGEERKYRLQREYINVTVACICVRPSY